MTKPAISVEGLGKKYKIGLREKANRNFPEAVADAFAAPFRRLRRLGEKSNGEDIFWALRDVSFQVQPGEVVGIIGRNGAGKSTLLKILSRITEPTTGRAVIRGRVGSLLEVGTGFHPELTGRENVYLNGAILGMKKAEIHRKFDEIVAFAEVEKFLDTPVKRYSSGMYVRLAFAVAAHLEPEILIVDEVLAVGDTAFQKKCLGKMQDVAGGGRTILFVSHNMAAISKLCERCLWFDSGVTLRSGKTREVVAAYLGHSTPGNLRGHIDLRDWPHRKGTGSVRVLEVRLLDSGGQVCATFYRTKPMVIEFTCKSASRDRLNLSAICSTVDGIHVLHVSHQDGLGHDVGAIEGHFRVQFAIPQLPLLAGRYCWTIGVHTELMSPLDVVFDAAPFVVEEPADSPRNYRATSENAICWTQTHWSLDRL